jgi:hypothetical protein
MFYGERVIDIPDGLPKWEGMADKSELIEDSPKEEIRENERKRVKREKDDKGKDEKKNGKD